MNHNEAISVNAHAVQDCDQFDKKNKKYKKMLVLYYGVLILMCLSSYVSNSIENKLLHSAEDIQYFDAL